ncbi:hypothetical protein DZ858_04675 [Marixanthomonas ophiurae]|uniref:Uncharacterized protein n=2 Tax=Marixanthomonas ophiurae TaxID=387659 RepID=A0A3E1QB74_9FLAO|nr:hypothetical protein DZ858_04675 [Marixanthomonas ophiurae]
MIGALVKLNLLRNLRGITFSLYRTDLENEIIIIKFKIMKKSILAIAIAIALGSLTAVNAQDGAIAQASSDQATLAQKAQASEAQGFTEVKASELPKAILEAVSTKYDGATVSKAYKNAKDQYKLMLATADSKEKTVYVNSEGQWLQTK